MSTSNNDKYAEIDRKIRKNYAETYPGFSEEFFEKDMENRHQSCRLMQKYEMTNVEFKAAEVWMDEHKKKHLPSTRTVAGQYYTRFDVTSIGDGVEIGCTICGENKDITDIDKF